MICRCPDCGLRTLTPSSTWNETRTKVLWACQNDKCGGEDGAWLDWGEPPKADATAIRALPSPLASEGARSAVTAPNHGGRTEALNGSGGEGSNIRTVPRRRGEIDLGEIVSAVCGEFVVPIDWFFGDGRHRTVVLSRTMVSYIARRLTLHSLPELAERLRAGRIQQHSTISTQIKNLTKLSGRTVRAYIGDDPSLNDPLLDSLIGDVAERIEARLTSATDIGKVSQKES